MTIGTTWPPQQQRKQQQPLQSTFDNSIHLPAVNGLADVSTSASSFQTSSSSSTVQSSLECSSYEQQQHAKILQQQQQQQQPKMLPQKQFKQQLGNNSIRSSSMPGVRFPDFTQKSFPQQKQQQPQQQQQESLQQQQEEQQPEPPPPQQQQQVGPGQNLIAPRRGKGILKQPTAGQRIPLCGFCNTQIRLRLQ